ncbi:MAG: hypothetical protein NTY19_16430 [Planctomycetota bacterium]|nr:hypothetical protein [Planctomycetota bacterium]
MPIEPPVDIHATDDGLSTQAMMRLAETAGAFDFWHAPGEDVYSVEDGEPIRAPSVGRGVRLPPSSSPPDPRFA